MSDVPQKLRDAAVRVCAGEDTHTTVRDFLTWFGQERRGWRVVQRIRRALKSEGLRTEPDFDAQWIDGLITLTLTDPDAAKTEKPEPPEPEPAEIVVVGGAVEDPTFRIGRLEAANKPPQHVKPDATLEEAITIMLREDFSQLPVMTNERDVKGAITWRTIATRVACGGSCKFVRDCLDSTIEIVASDVSLFRAIELIADHEFVLVRDDIRKISGIVTATDLSWSFYQLGLPFLLLSEIENHLRGLIDGKFTPEEFAAARNPEDTQREIKTVADLTFGEYVRLLQDPSKWAKVGLHVDRATLIKDLERTNDIRNDVMHFDPDGISPEDLKFLRKVANFMQELRDIAASACNSQ